jgi:hypothetical protein
MALAFHTQILSTVLQTNADVELAPGAAMQLVTANPLRVTARFYNIGDSNDAGMGDVVTTSGQGARLLRLD